MTDNGNYKKKTVNCSARCQKALNEKYFYLYDLEYEEKFHKLNGIAISVFNHWLSKGEAKDLIEGSSPEESDKRYSVHKRFNYFLVENYRCLTYKFRGKLNRRFAKFKEFTSLEQSRRFVDPSTSGLSNKYRFSLVIPEFNAVYFEGSDYTNYLYSDSPDNLSILSGKAKDLGLFTLPLE